MTTGLRRDQVRGFEIRNGEVDADAIADGSITPVKFNATVYGTGTTTIDPDDTVAHGASTALSRTDHQHPITAGTPDGLTLTGTSAENNGTSFARNNHTHATNELPWGVVAQQVLTSDSTGYTASGASDMLLNNVSVVQGRMYQIILHSAWQLTPGATFAEWNINLHLNGAVLDHFDKATQYVTQNGFGTFNGICYWVAPTTQATDDFTVEHVEVSGSYTLTYKATSTVPRTLTIIDIGVL